MSRVRFFKCLPYELKAFTDLSVYEQEKLRLRLIALWGVPRLLLPISMTSRCLLRRNVLASTPCLGPLSEEDRLAHAYLSLRPNKGKIREAALLAAGNEQYDERGYLCTAYYRE